MLREEKINKPGKRLEVFGIFSLSGHVLGWHAQRGQKEPGLCGSIRVWIQSMGTTLVKEVLKRARGPPCKLRNGYRGWPGVVTAC